jgi:hypothetical protein
MKYGLSLRKIKYKISRSYKTGIHNSLLCYALSLHSKYLVECHRSKNNGTGENYRKITKSKELSELIVYFLFEKINTIDAIENIFLQDGRPRSGK